MSGRPRETVLPDGLRVLTWELPEARSAAAGLYLPFGSRDDVDFYTLLEMHLRQEGIRPLAGRDHLSYRSYYFPVKECIDGDFCETFSQLPVAKQREIAEAISEGCNVEEVCRRLEDMRQSIM